MATCTECSDEGSLWVMDDGLLMNAETIGNIQVTCALGSVGCTGEAYLTTVWEKRRNKAYKRIRCKKCKRFRSVSHTIPDEEMLRERLVIIERTC